MEWVETTGRTIEEAKDAALDQLGVAEDEAEFEVLEEPRGGLFGRLRSEARVRARVLPTRPRAKDDRRDRGRRRRPGRDQERPAERPERAPSRPAGSRDGERRPPRDQAPATRDSRDEVNEGGLVEEDVSIEAQAEVARTFIEGLVEQFGASANVAIRPIDEETVEIAVTGDDLGLLIGPRGQTLTAVQELARTVVQRQTGSRHGRVLVDVAGYRQARRDALSRFTQGQAEEVLASGAQRALEPMTPADRKVVHDTVNDIEGVRTVSEGEEPRRRVVIVPE